ncbi:hypothetical protein LWI28_002548 [Acer negundo]|uniref:Stress-response A/B barrel domain-containing protein n=1 Tax=Acer negundo TaxID=4023 RepID=A0AAD5J7Z1_ACENE|nr:hypothetical protein LWI28_002548 [Acer negundo]KAK4853613.1 hypothetical protein QYF36_011614 [Acer negundo]
MLCMRALPLLSTQFSLTFSPPKRLPKLKSSFSVKSAMSSSSSTIEHVVLLKVKPDADSSKVDTMITDLKGLISIDNVLYLTCGPVLSTAGSSLLTFTYMLHSRYNSKTDLDNYLQNPNHLSVVKDYVIPLSDDIMSIDWVADRTPSTIVIPTGCAVRVTFLKLKENLGEEVKDVVLGVIKENNENLGGIKQFTCGEIFSPALAKGFSIASIAIFKGVNEMEEADLNLDRVKDYVESVIAVDYVVPSS